MLCPQVVYAVARGVFWTRRKVVEQEVSEREISVEPQPVYNKPELDKVEVEELEASSKEVPKYCLSCGAEVKSGYVFCFKCGEPVKTLPSQGDTIQDKCPFCGFEIQSGDIFCGNCGKKVAGPDIGGPNVKELEPLKAPIMPEEESGYRFHYIEYSEKDTFRCIDLMIKDMFHDQINLKGIGELSASTIGFVGSPTISMYYKIDNGNPVSINLTPSGRCTALLDTTKLSDGEHILTVKAVDSQSRQATKSVKIIIKNKS